MLRESLEQVVLGYLHIIERGDTSKPDTSEGGTEGLLEVSHSANGSNKRS